jgi:hypothetical protein
VVLRRALRAEACAPPLYGIDCTKRDYRDELPERVSSKYDALLRKHEPSTLLRRDFREGCREHVQPSPLKPLVVSRGPRFELKERLVTLNTEDSGGTSRDAVLLLEPCGAR